MKKNKVNKNVNNITFMIHPTPYQDYDVVAVGSLQLLTKLNRVTKGSQLFKKSKFGGIPILIIDTCDTLRDALKLLKEYKALYES